MHLNGHTLAAIPRRTLDAVVALYCEEDRWRAQVQHVLRRHVDFLEARTLETLVQLGGMTSCSVLVIARHQSDYTAALRRRHPLHPLVLVSNVEGREATCLVRSPRDEVVLFREVDRGLGPAVSRASVSGVLEQLAIGIETEKRIAPLLRAALAFVYRARPPIRSIKELAAQVGCDPRTLEHHWRTAVPRADGLRLHDVLSWMLLLHASTARVRTANWSAVGADLGVCVQTIARLARALADLSLREVAALGLRGTLPLFTKRVLPALAVRETLRVLT